MAHAPIRLDVDDNDQPLGDDQGPIPAFPPLKLDERGRIIPLSSEEWEARSETARRMLNRLRDTEEVDPPGSDEEFLRTLIGNAEEGEVVASSREQVEAIRALITQFAHDRDQAEAKVGELNSVILQLHVAKLLEEGVVVVGPILDYISNPEQESIWATLAAIDVPRGFGTVQSVIDWVPDPDDMDQDREISSNFIPFNECKPAIQVRFIPHIDNLVAELLARVTATTGRA
jgi:hypothetical protein